MQKNVALSIVAIVFLVLAALAPVLEIARDSWLLAGLLVFAWVAAIWRN